MDQARSAIVRRSHHLTGRAGPLFSTSLNSVRSRVRLRAFTYGLRE